MKEKKIKTLFILLIVSSFSVILYSPISSNLGLYQDIPLKAIAVNSSIFPDYLNFLKQHLARINIDLEIELYSYSDFYNQLGNIQDFDIFFFEFTNKKYDVDFSELFSSNGFFNIFGYYSTMDFDNELNLGINDWYLKNGSSISPINSTIRINHYKQWQKYLQNKILPLKPLFSYEEMFTYWNNLKGFNVEKGLIESWGKMYWDELHENQDNITEIVIADNQWIDLNPLFQCDPASIFLTKASLDPLFWIDDYINPIENNSSNVHPHLVESYEVINKTYLRLYLREGVKWQTDPDGLFPNEYFDAEDIYFTLYCWKHLSKEKELYFWLKDIKIIDEYTIDIFVDSNPLTIECDPYSPLFSKINVLVLPEHFLNQTQLEDHSTPDTSHVSWDIFSSNCFGTGLFEIQDSTIDSETNLHIFNEGWWLNESLTNDTRLNFMERFGEFNHNLTKLKIRIIPDSISAYLEAKNGFVDLVSIPHNDYMKREFTEYNTNFTNQNITRNSLSFFGFNLRENRAYIGDRSLSPIDPSFTRGLALRKAISYAIDRSEMNAVLHNLNASYNYWPLYPVMEEYRYEFIYKYNFNIDTARQYLTIADIQIPTTPTNELENWQKVLIAISFLPGIAIVVVTIRYFIKNVRKRVE